jgi:DNA-binding GntR family transcriptional regulator
MLPSAADSIQRRTLHDELTERLKDLIFEGHLLPGQKIPERELCERFGVSKTPLREALKVLASEGIVTLRPNRGAIVSTLTVEELDELFPVIGALEALAGEIACSRITDAEVVEIRKRHDAMVGHWKRRNLQRYFARNREIHEAILDATRNETLKSTYRGLSGRVLRARYIANMSPDRWAQAVAEHEAIIEALSERDGRRLSEILKAHLANKLETVKEWLAQQTPPPPQAKSSDGVKQPRLKRAEALREF